MRTSRFTSSVLSLPWPCINSSASSLRERPIDPAMASLLEHVTIGNRLPLRNRLAMASMTRNRCVDDFKPGQAQVKHYADRARDGPGIIVSEGILVDWAGIDWTRAPFMISDEHAEAWRAVVEAVHAEGALMYFQAWHPGMWGHGSFAIGIWCNLSRCRTMPA